MDLEYCVAGSDETAKLISASSRDVDLPKNRRTRMNLAREFYSSREERNQLPRRREDFNATMHRCPGDDASIRNDVVVINCSSRRLEVRMTQGKGVRLLE